MLFRAALAIELLAIALVLFSLFFNAPLEGIADPTHTPNPAKAPWYFLGLQELLHYFPPVVAGVLVPTLLIISLVIIPYFNVNIEANGLFLKDRTKRLRLFYVASLGMLIFLLVFHVYVAVRAHGACGAGDDRRRQQHARFTFTNAPLSGPEAAGLLDHDVVSFRTDCAHRCRHMVPRPGLVLGLALEELSAIH